MLTSDAASKDRRTHWIRTLLRWLLVAVILWFLGRRLAEDWPTVRSALTSLRWTWLVLGFVPGVFYFIFRVWSWKEVLTSLSVPSTFRRAGRIWMNAEFIRYIPGNIWSVLGRLAQAGVLKTTRTTIFSSMVIEAVFLVVGAVAVSALLLIPYPALIFSGRTTLLILIALLSFSVGAQGVTTALTTLVFRILRRTDQIPAIRGAFGGYFSMLGAWVCFALASLLVTFALYPLTSVEAAIGLAGAFVASWLIGYLSFLTPSGLGVREAALVYLLSPYLDVTDAILLAVVSRVALIVFELIALIVANVLGRRTVYPRTIQHPFM